LIEVTPLTFFAELIRRHKPTPFAFSRGITTPTDHGFYGKKRLDGKGFV